MYEHDGASAEERELELREAIVACRARIEATGLGAQEWLDHRWEELNATRPPMWLSRHLHTSALNPHREDELVPVPLIVQGGGEAQWGDVNNRGGSYRQIVQGLLDSSVDEWLHRMGTVSLTEYEGPLGPTYEVCSFGRHRVHTVKALELPYLNANVDQTWSSPQVGDEIIGNGRKHMLRLGEFGFLDDVDVRGTFPVGVLATPLQVPWALEPPKSVAEKSRDYATIYPEFREHPFYELTSTPEVSSTLEYLTRYAPTPNPPPSRSSWTPVAQAGWWARLRRRLAVAFLW